MTKSRRIITAAFLGFTAVALGACNAVVSNNGTPYSYANPSTGTVVVTAPPTSGTNQREFFWDGGNPTEADSTVCATFASGQGNDQQGIVLRLHWSPNNTTGIDVDRNIFLGAYNDFNYHTWSTANGDPSSSQFANTVLPALPVAPAVYPLNMCARTQGDVIQFVVWLPGQAQPVWGNPTWGGQATIPAGAPTSGQGGLFAAHLTPGTSMTYTNVSVDGVPDANPIAAPLPT
jgi:hypothetical protein